MRDGHRCRIQYTVCTVVATEVDHILPAMGGGSDQVWNLQAACGPCHRSKSGREAQSARPRRKRDKEAHPGFVDSASARGQV